MPQPWDAVPSGYPVGIYEDTPGDPAATVTGVFEGTVARRRRFARRPAPAVAVSETRPVGLSIGRRDNFDGTFREILRFHGAVSGKENFTLDAGLGDELFNLAEAGRPFRICQGVAGERPSCHVDAAEVLAVLSELRPGIVPVPAASLLP